MKNAKRKNVRNWIPDSSAGFGTSTSLSAGKAGSALILTVVLTSLLAIIGMMFVMAANMDKLTSSSVSTNKELQFAVDSVVAEISQQLILDVPGIKADPNGRYYYDYPGTQDPWLASLEPDDSNNWRHISDIYVEWATPGLNSPGVIPEHQTITGISSPADADGDGVADSRWTELRTSPADANKPVMTKSGKRIYAAIRVIDNGAMLNVNTGFKFDTSSTDPNLSDGSSQLQINLMALAGRPDPNSGEDTQLWQHRYPNSTVNTSEFEKYKRDVVWHYEPNNPSYTPFDISDELELRNRFLLNNENIDTRLEGWGGEFRSSTISTPVGESSSNTLSDWYKRTHDESSGGTLDPMYSYRHLATIYNMDRIIDPNGLKMADVNDSNAMTIFKAIKKSDPNILDATAAQITVNLIDYCDKDSDVTTFTTGGVTHYGFERPCIYISELAHKYAQWTDTSVSPAVTVIARSYAIEFFKPYTVDADPNASQKWRLRVSGQVVQEPIDWTQGSKLFHVVVLEDPAMDNPTNHFPNSKIGFDVNGLLYEHGTYPGELAADALVELQREIYDKASGTYHYITVDSHNFAGGFQIDPTPKAYSTERDVTDSDRCIRRLWRDTLADATLGKTNGYDSHDTAKILAHPANKPFTTIGEIGKIFHKSAYTEASDFITAPDTEPNVMVDLAKTSYQKLFDYLTLLDPTVYSWNDPNETRIKGRININTAPWYVIAQLPWQNGDTAATRFDRAQKICTYRDSHNGFTSIGELMNVSEMLPTSYTNFAQRDSIFSRLSNLVTVRSDVFTAYILVRLGPDGPQKRVIAILDRSDVYSAKDKVKIVALWPVPDAR